MGDFYYADPAREFHTGAAVAVSNFTAKQDISGALRKIIPPTKLRRGSQFHYKAWGEYSSLTGAALTLGVWFGTRAGTITGDLALGSAFTTGTTPTAWPWELEWEGFLNSDPSTAATLLGQGKYRIGASLTTFNNEQPMPITQALRTVSSFDTTIERAIGVSATWGAASASNTITQNGCRLMFWN